jgi:hypothetical protein
MMKVSFSVILFVSMCFVQPSADAQFRDVKHLDGLKQVPPLTSEEEDSDGGFVVREFLFEVQTAVIEDFIMQGVRVKFELFEPLNVSARFSVDLRDGSMFFIPYFGINLPRIGGFEIGSLSRPREAQFTVPGWVTWRIYGGDERIFAISADVLTNVPIGSIGVYDAGVRFRVGRDGSTMYVGFANYGKDRTEIGVAGPSVKSTWALGDKSFLLLNASYILDNPTDKYFRFTLSAGWRVVI